MMTKKTKKQIIQRLTMLHQSLACEAESANGSASRVYCIR